MNKQHLFKPSRKVQVYRNLHAELFSVRQDGIVLFHKANLLLKDAEFRVQPAGKDKVRETQRKNVHAYVSGYMLSKKELNDMYNEAGLEDNEHFGFNRVTYNPYKYDSFWDLDNNAPIYKADIVDMDIHGIVKILAVNTKVVQVG